MSMPKMKRREIVRVRVIRDVISLEERYYMYVWRRRHLRMIAIWVHLVCYLTEAYDCVYFRKVRKEI